jgi:hypothetical protein
MESDGTSAHLPLFSSETLLLWVAVGLAIIFLGLLVFDLLRRRRPRRRRRREPEKLGPTLLKPFTRLRAFQAEVKKVLRHRSRRRLDDRPRPPESPRQ